MAITTDITYEVKYNGTTVDEIGQSKTLNLLTSAEIEEFLYCGCYNNTMSGNLYAYTTDAGSYDTWNSLNNKYMPFKTDAVTGSYMQMLAGGGSYNDTTENGRYIGVVLVVDTTGEGYVNSITQTNAAKYRIVTELDARNYYIDHTGNFAQVDGYGATDWDDENAGLYNYDYTGEVLHYVYDDEGTKRDINLYGEITVFPYAVFVDANSDLLYLVKLSSNVLHLSFKAHIAPNYNAGYCLLNFTGNNSAENSLSITYNCLNFGSSFTDTGDSSYNWPYPSTHNVYKYHKTDKGLIGRTHFQYHDFETAFWFTKLEQLLWLFACSGLKFQCDGTMYKPLISDNVVYGYTDDLTKESELDNYTGSTKHDIPVTPPAPPVPPIPWTDEDNNDTIPTVGAPFSSGLARYYATTAGSTILNHISEAMGAWNLKDTGKDLYRNIISCKLIKPPAALPVSGSEPFVVYGVTLQYEGSDITLPVINDNPTKSFGSYNIPRKFNDFRDFAPYTKVEIFLPYCGWTVLPSHVVGRSVSVTYYTDIIAATCKAVVYCGANVVAEAAGVIGLDIPMVTENAGAKAEAVTMGLLAYGKAGLQTALGVGAAVATKGKAGVKTALGGLENVVSAYSQTAMAFNQNYTEINGKNGDGCCIAGISAIVIKITRPKFGANTTAPYVPSEYGHSTGFVSMKSAKVGSFTGLLVADNVDTSGISGATDREKQLIKLYLESGIYVNHPS